MDVVSSFNLSGIFCDWVLPIIVVFALEVVGYVLYTRYRGRQTPVAPPTENAAPQPEKAKSDSWPRSLRLRSECSTDLNSDADYLASRQGSGDLGSMNQDVLTHRSCSIPSRVAGLALDGVVLRRSTAPPTANRQGLSSDFSDCSLPRSYTPCLADEVGRRANIYTPRDMLDMFCCMRRNGCLDGKIDVQEQCSPATPNIHHALAQGPTGPTSHFADNTVLPSDRRSSHHIQSPQAMLSPTGPWDSGSMHCTYGMYGPNASDRLPNDKICTSSQKGDRNDIANNEARPLLYKALKFRQLDIASTIYLGFKHESLSIRPETFMLLVQVALSAKAYATSADWLVELLRDHDIDPDWLDRVIAAISVGAPLVLKSLIDHLEELRKANRLSAGCSAIVAHACSYLALVSSHGGLGFSNDGKNEAPRLSLAAAPPPVGRSPGYPSRPEPSPITSRPVRREQQAALVPYPPSPPSSKGLNPNAPEFVPVCPTLADPAHEDIQQTVLAHQQLQQNILMILQQKPGDIPAAIMQNNTVFARQNDLQMQEAPRLSIKELQTMTQMQQVEEPKEAGLSACEPAEDSATNQQRNPCAEETDKAEPREAPVAAEHPSSQQPSEQQDKEQPSGTQQEQQSGKVQLTLQQQLQQHLERALMQHGTPPGLPPPRRHLRSSRQTETPARVQSESCRSPTHSKDDNVASRKKIADALISRISSRSKTIA